MAIFFRSEKYFPARIFIIALIIRLIPVLFTSSLGIGLDDMFQYDMLARSLESGNGYRWYAEEDLNLVQKYIDFDMSNVEYDPRGILTSFRPPLYPAFLALIYSIFGVSVKRFFVIRLIQSLMGALLAPLTFWISQYVFPQKYNWSRLSAWIISLYPMLVIYPLSFATENLFFLITLCSILILLIGDKKRKSYLFVLGGVFLGLNCLTRSVAMAFAGLAVGWVWYFLKERRFALIMVLMVSIVTLPWIIRNSVLHHKLTGIESALGYDLYVGYHPDGTGTFQYGISLDLFPYLDDGLRDEIGQNQALEFIQANPLRVPYLVIRKLGYFWGLERRAITYFYSNNYFGPIPHNLLIFILLIFLSPFIFVSLAAVMGLAFTKWNRSNLIIGIFILAYLIPHILILAEDRFHLALIPFLSIYAAIFWGEGWSQVKGRWKTLNGKIYIIVALLISLLLIVNWSMELYRDKEILYMLLGPNGNTTYLPY